MGTLDVGLLLVFLVLCFLITAFRRLLRYKNDPLFLLLLGLVLLLGFATKALTHVDYFRHLSLPYYAVYLELAVGFAVGPTMLILATVDRHARLRRVVHYGLCLVPLVLFVCYAARPFPAQGAQVLRILNGEDRLYNWLNLLLAVHVGGYLLGWSAAAQLPPLGRAGVVSAYLVVLLACSLCSLWPIGLHGSIFPAVAVASCVVAVVSVVAIICPSREIRRHLLQRESREAAAREVVRYFQSSKPFLEKRATLASVARAMGYSRNELSSTINSCFSKNFTQLMNEYRVDEAKRRLADPAFDHIKIEYLGYECGFSSKGAFYTVFKDLTGHTPRSFRSARPRTGGTGKGLLGLFIAIPLSVACLTMSATCATHELPVGWLSGTYRSQTPFHGAVSLMRLRSDRTLSVNWFSFNGAHAFATAGTYSLVDGAIVFEAKGQAHDGGPEFDPKDRVEYALRGELRFSAERGRWTGAVWSGMPAWQMEDVAEFSLKPGIDFPILFREVLRRKGYVFGSLGLFLLVSWRQTKRIGQSRKVRSGGSLPSASPGGVD